MNRLFICHSGRGSYTGMVDRHPAGWIASHRVDLRPDYAQPTGDRGFFDIVDHVALGIITSSIHVGWRMTHACHVRPCQSDLIPMGNKSNVKVSTMTTKVSISPALNYVDSANAPLVKPEEVTAGNKLSPAERALSNLAISKGLTEVINRNAEADTVRLAHKSLIAESIAEYWQAVDATAEGKLAGAKAAETVEAATANVSHKLADAILANAITRKEARQQMGAAFGFELSKTTGKPTAKPIEPGNTISKRVSSVTIAAEYAMTGTLPDKGGDNLPLVGQSQVMDLLADYFDGSITVRAASERIEAAIREARVTIPLEMNIDKLLSFAGKIETARDAIAADESLKECYGILLQVIAGIPFPSAGEE